METAEELIEKAVPDTTGDLEASAFYEYDFHDEIIQIEMLFQSHILSFGYKEYSLETYADRRFFSEWKAREDCADTDEMRAGYNIDGILRSADPSEGEVLTYCQYVLNIAELCRRSYNKEEAPGYDFDIRNYTELLSRIRSILKRLHYEVKFVPEKEFIYIVPRDPAAEALTEEPGDPMTAVITEYRSTAAVGDLDRKKELLTRMGDVVEGYSDNLSGTNAVLFSRIQFMLNNINIRNDNRSGEERIGRVADMSGEELEEWYDTTYQMLLLRIMEHSNKERLQSVDQLARECGMNISAITEEEMAALMNGELPDDEPVFADDIPSVTSARERMAADTRPEHRDGAVDFRTMNVEENEDEQAGRGHRGERGRKGGSIVPAVAAIIAANFLFVLFLLIYFFILKGGV